MASLLQITKAYKSYGDQVLLDGADAVLSDNIKVGFIGRNGAGKSTLLRVLLGEEELDSGEIVRSSSLRLGYLRQHDPSTGRNRFGVPDARQRSAQLEMWRSRGAI
jgi:ATP-binding cassette, subfamily F, member 3